MKKSLVICILIVLVIVLGDVVVQKFVDKKFNLFTQKLDEISYNYDNYDESKKSIQELKSMLDESYKVMACFLEHDELEKVITQFYVIEASIDVKDFENVYVETNRAKYIIEHINEKEKLRIDNIF